MLLWIISVLLLNSSEVYPAARFTLYICHWSRRSASLQSSLPSFPKTTHVRIASSIAVDLSAKLTQNNSLPADLLTNRLQRATAVVTMRNFMCCSEWLECLSWSYTEFFSSARLNCHIYHHLSHRQQCWRVTSQLFQCFGDLNLNQIRLEQDPGLGGGLRTVFIKFEIIIFWFANWIQKHSGMISGNIFEDYMEAQDQIQRNI